MAGERDVFTPSLLGSINHVAIAVSDLRGAMRFRAVDVAALGLIRSVFPPPKGVRLVGVTLSNFMVPRDGVEVDDPLLPRPDGHEASI